LLGRGPLKLRPFSPAAYCAKGGPRIPQMSDFCGCLVATSRPLDASSPYSRTVLECNFSEVRTAPALLARAGKRWRDRFTTRRWAPRPMPGHPGRGKVRVATSDRGSAHFAILPPASLVRRTNRAGGPSLARKCSPAFYRGLRCDLRAAPLFSSGP
jgi:hypothetical protein